LLRPAGRNGYTKKVVRARNNVGAFLFLGGGVNVSIDVGVIDELPK